MTKKRSTSRLRRPSNVRPHKRIVTRKKKRNPTRLKRILVTVKSHKRHAKVLRKKKT